MSALYGGAKLIERVETGKTPGTRSPWRGEDRLGVGGMVLLSLVVGLHVGRRHQAYRVSERLESRATSDSMAVMSIDLMDPAHAVDGVGGRRSLEAAVGLPTQLLSPAEPFVLLVGLAGLAGVAPVYGIRTRSGAGGLVGPTGAIAPDPVAVALDLGRLLADGRTVRLRVVVGAQRR